MTLALARGKSDRMGHDYRVGANLERRPIYVVYFEAGWKGRRLDYSGS